MKTLKEINNWEEMIGNVVNCDCVEGMQKIAENSIDAIITDPPYGLEFMGKKWDSFKSINSERERSVNEITAISRGPESYQAGKPFQEFCFNWAKECLRILKPGGYLLSFGGTRTCHRMICGIEDAGFRIRDMIIWAYGSGFPKSTNVGKMVDRLLGNERKETIKRVIPYKDKRRSVLQPKDGWNNNSMKTEFTETKGTSEWEGWGTALKPSFEPICVARKPLEKGLSVAENCLKWGVGGINIDESRVGTEDTRQKTGGAIEGSGWGTKGGAIAGSELGRFPANLIHDNSEEVKECFPETKNGGQNKTSKRETWLRQETKPTEYNGDFGNASRFFKSIAYYPKASRAERNKGCEGLEKGNNHCTVKGIALMEYLINMVSRKDALIVDPFTGSGSTLIACKKLDRRFIGFEQEQDYCKITDARIDAYITQGTLFDF